MLLTEYNEAEQMELFRQDGYVEGFLESFLENYPGNPEEGKRKAFIILAKKGRVSIGCIATHAGMTTYAFMRMMEEEIEKDRIEREALLEKTAK